MRYSDEGVCWNLPALEKAKRLVTRVAFFRDDGKAAGWVQDPDTTVDICWWYVYDATEAELRELAQTLLDLCLVKKGVK